MALEVGSRLGHYDVTALIGEGGMGQVYQATDTKLLRIPGAAQGPTFPGAEKPPVYIGRCRSGSTVTRRAIENKERMKTR